MIFAGNFTGVFETNNAIPFTAMLLDAGVGAVGQTVTVDVFRISTGVKLVDSAAVTEVGGGIYRYTLLGSFTANPDLYAAIFKTTGAHTATFAQVVLPTNLTLEGVTSSELAAALWDTTAGSHNTPNTMGAKLNAAGAAADPLASAVPANYPIGSAGHALGRIGSAQLRAAVMLVQSVDYTVAAEREVVFTDSLLTWPTLTGAAIVGTLRNKVTGSRLALTGIVVSATGAKSIAFEFPAATLATLELGPDRYELTAVAVLDSGTPTLVVANVTIVA